MKDTGRLRVTVLGYLGHNAELRYSPRGTAIAGFRIAVNQVRTGANGQRDYLGHNAELRYSPRGTAIAGFRIAVNQVRTGANGQREETTEWFRINVTGHQAEFAASLQKGQRVLVIGRLQISHFTRTDGTQGTGFDVWADEVQNVSARSAAADGENERALVGVAAGDVADEPTDIEDLPF